MRLIIRIILFYCCISLFSEDLISLAIKLNETYAIDIEKEKSEESKEESNKEIEEKYTSHHDIITITHFVHLQSKVYRIDQVKAISQIYQEINSPPPNC